MIIANVLTSIREAVLTAVAKRSVRRQRTWGHLATANLVGLPVSPKRPYLGFNDPMTFATTGPEWKPKKCSRKRIASGQWSGVRATGQTAQELDLPTRIRMYPFSGSSSSMSI
jgi:hypothetical protein